MSVKLKHEKRVFIDGEIEQYCYSVEQLLIDIKNRSNVNKNKKLKKTEKIKFSSEDDSQIFSMN